MSRARTLVAAFSILALTAGAPAVAQAWWPFGSKDRDRAAPVQRDRAFPDIAYADWSDAEPAYRVYPGDELEIFIASAPELNKTGFIQPDGRIALPLVGPVMVADRTLPEVEAALAGAYSRELLRPQVTVAVKTAQPLKVFVYGEVEKAGVYDMPGDINSLQAVAMAGGFKVSAKRKQVVVLRRTADGRFMRRTVDLLKGSNQGGADLVPLRRFDLVYVPRSDVAEANLFLQQYFRDLIPISFGFSYDLNPRSNQ
ncbi:MAG: polysaccharide biosynthesis/export family protein [Caulobacter sp.]|nr:polysaccharide biosynthesis/export family protein [Caulobacter sp.]